jgi:hypothetical protein
MDLTRRYIMLLKLAVGDGLRFVNSALVAAPSERPSSRSRAASCLRYEFQRLLEPARRVRISAASSYMTGACLLLNAERTAW